MAAVPTSVTEYQTGFAPEIAPYAQGLLGQSYGTLFDYQKDPSGNIMYNTTTDSSGKEVNGLPKIAGFKPFQEYATEDRFAQFSPLQQQAFSGAQGMQPSQTTAGASQLAGMAGLGALGTNYQPINFQSQSILGGGFGGGRRGGYGGDRMVGYDSGSQTPRSSGGGNDNGMFGGGMGGGFGGFGMPQNNLGAYMSPYMQNVVGIQQREAQRNADIAGTQQQAQATKAGAFGGGRDAIMRAEAARNLATQKGDIQAKGLQDAYTQAMGQFNTEQQARQQAAQLNAQQQQYGAGLGLQGLQTALSGANTLGQLGQQQFQQGMDVNKLQAQYGGEQQKQMQQMLEADYQNFINKQNYPYKQLGFMSDMIRGLPLSQTGSSVYQQPPSTLGQIGGLALGAASLFGKKDGGSVHSYKEGGELSITKPDDSKLEEMMDGMADWQLQQIIRSSSDPSARRVAQEILASHSSISHALNRGGMVAFAEGGDKGEKKEDSSGVSGLAYLAAAFPGLFQAGKAVVGPAASSIGSALKAIGTGVSNTGAAYSNPATSAVLGGGLALSDANTRYLNKLSDEDLATLAESGGGSDAALAAAIMGQGRETTKKKDEYAAEVGGGRGKAPASAYDVQALAEHLGKSTRGETAKDGKGGGASAASQKIVQGATRVAEQQGVPKETFESMMDRMMAKFKGANDKDLEGLAKMIAEEKENAKSVMGDATRNALAKFGFQMAANASQPGAGKGIAGALRSAASAGPALAESMQESRKLAQAAQDNARKMQIEFTKYKVALDKGDQQLAISTASNLRMMQQQQAQLEETIRHNKASEGLMGQRVSAMAGRGQEKTFAPILRGIGQANQMASKNAMELIKARPDLIQKGEKPEDALERVRSALAAKYRKEAVPMFGPTGKVYGGGNDDDMEE